MNELYQELNRLKSYGMKGWHQTKEEWVTQRVEGEDIEALIKYLHMFLSMKNLNRKGFNVETVIASAIEAIHTEQEHLRQVYENQL